jgi:hypothetical protein
MTLSFYFDFSIYSILISALWIIRDTTLVLWAQTMKKRETQSKYINYLHITGIILLTWSILSVFLPNFRLSNYTESEFHTYNTIIFIYDLIPIILGVFLGVTLSLYFYNTYFQHNRKSFLGPGLFLLGHVIYLFFIIISYSIFTFEYTIFNATYEVYLIGIILTKTIPIVGISFIFLYSIYINNDLLIMFCGLFFAYLMISLVYSINYTTQYFYYYW